jgi:hypothetical protein
MYAEVFCSLMAVENMLWQQWIQPLKLANKPLKNCIKASRITSKLLATFDG